MVLKLYNTRTRQKQVFAPIDEATVRMYVCGPTAYDLAHIGNARPLIVFDVLFRLLRNLYGETRVIYARNITDVDDKINARAAREGISIRDLTERTAAKFQADAAALGCLAPTVEPRATEHIPEMISIVERLIKRGHAYEAEGHVLFDVASDPSYGALARRSLDEMRAGARVEVAPYKRDPMDFVLWKPSSENEPGWESPWGYGRPGWHLECSAMAEKHLGEVFDIHGGGIDLVFPHHENEVAQSTCAHGTDIMANIWMHNGHLQVEGEKMSKSLGNFVTIDDIVSKGRMSAAAARLAMLSTHYRQPIDWTGEKLRDAAASLQRLLAPIKTHVRQSNHIDPRVLGPLLDDLNTPGMIAGLHEILKDLATANDTGREADEKRDTVANALSILGFDAFLDFDASAWAREQITIDAEKVEALTAARLAARKQKNWKEADRIRDELAAMGITLRDAKNPETGEIETVWDVVR